MNLQQNLENITHDLGLIFPEVTLFAAIVLLLITDLFFGLKQKGLWLISLIGLIISTYFSIDQFFTISDPVIAFGKMITLDHQAIFWKILISVSAIIVIIINWGRSTVHRHAEYYIMLLGIQFGAHFLIMSSNFLMVFFSIEIISITSYIFTYFSFNKVATEASMKYLLFGATASATMLYGLSLLYAQTGTLEFGSQVFIDGLLNAHIIPLTVASILVLAGLFFKLAAAPMHIWAPDVYTSAPTPVVAYFSVVPKLAGFAIFIKLILTLNLFGQSPINWILLLSCIAMLSIMVGNFSALWQSNIKRLLAYSSIAQTGFLIAGLAAFSPVAYTNVLFYASVFSLSNLGVFLIVHYFERKYNYTVIKDYQGLIKSHPFLTICLLVLLVSLTGLPPTAGFTAKFLIFSSIWESYSYTGEQWLLYLLIFGLVNTVISLFYYIKLPYYMIFKEEGSDAERKKYLWGYENFFAGLLVVAILLLFFKPDWLMGLINSFSLVF